MGKFFEDKRDFWLSTIGFTVFFGGFGVLGYARYLSRNEQPIETLEIKKDLNGDGIEDKLLQKWSFETHRTGMLVTKRYISLLETEVLYGADVKGKRVYLQQGEFETLKKQTPF